MDSAAAGIDPRSIITPEAFEISEELLGRPLAGPWSRLWALLVDLALIGLLSLAGGLVLGVAAVFFLLRIALSSEGRNALNRVYRFSVGCLGATILLVTSCAILVFTGDREIAVPDVPVISGGSAEQVSLSELVTGMSGVQAFRSAETREDAVAAAAGVARTLGRVGTPHREVETTLRELAPTDASWSDELDAVVAEAMQEVEPAGAEDPGPAQAPATAGEAEDSTAAVASDTLGLAAALERYLALERRPDSGAPGERARLGARLTAELDLDTVAVLKRSVEASREERALLEARLARTRQELQEEREEGLLGWLWSVVDDMGIAFGWGTIYMTVFLAWWNGQTPGKRLMGIRVVQLDRTPLSWWESFERAGGYAAGFATGLLGFAQVFWDPNRQAIHDKISETVVVVDGAEPVPGLWRAYRSPDLDPPQRFG